MIVAGKEYEAPRQTYRVSMSQDARIEVRIRLKVRVINRLFRFDSIVNINM